MSEPPAARSSMVTTAAIAVAAYALCDLTHEVAGHGLATLFAPNVKVVSLSTVALQTTGDSRAVAAAGSIANVVTGSAALAFAGRMERFSPTACFVWLFGALNLLNGTGYPFYSALLGSGDWEVVVRGWQPAWAWRLGLGLVGVAAYTASVRWSANAMTRFVEDGSIALAEIPRLVLTSYVVGGLLLVAASALNPISPSLILISGLSSGFGAMAGLTIVPTLVAKRLAGRESGDGVLVPSPGWIAAGLVIGAIFICVVGPGIQLRQP